MSKVFFNSYTFIKRLKATGFTEEQAEVIVDTSRDALSQRVTKDDLDQRVSALEQRMTIKFAALIAAAVGILIAVLRVPH